MSFVREKKTICGENYIEMDLFEMANMHLKGKSDKRKNASTMKQIAQNNKNARRYFTQLVNTNFGENDFCIHATYARACMPSTVEEAEKNVTNYMRRIKARRKKECLPSPRYIIVTEYRTKEDGRPTRIHHHIIMDGMLDRDIVADLWRAPRKKGEHKGRKLGMVNVDKLQPDEYGLEALARYLTKGLTGKKKWHPSKNLKKPVVRKNDYRYSRKKLISLTGQTDCPDVWQKLYPGYLLTEARAIFTTDAGWHITVKMRRDITYAKNHNSRHSSRAERIC